MELLRHQELRCANPRNMRDVSLYDVTTTNLVSSEACPTNCSCFQNVTDCSRKGLDLVPEDIGSDTRELFLQENAITRLDANQFLHLPHLE